MNKLNEVKLQAEEPIPIESGLDSSSEDKHSINEKLEDPITKAARLDNITEPMKERKQLSDKVRHSSFEQRKKSSDSNMDQKEMEEVQRIVNDYIDRIKNKLKAANKQISKLIDDQIVIGEIDGAEYEVIAVEALMERIKNVCEDEFNEEELKDIEEIFRQIGNSDYAFVENLLEFFNEPSAGNFV